MINQIKTFGLIFISMVNLAVQIQAQSIERSVVVNTGGYSEGAGVSVSWTLGEVVTATFSSGNTILTQGFQQPDLTLRIYVDLTAFLEGPFNGSLMNNSLSDQGLIPVNQPYHAAPWNYYGTESFMPGQVPNKVDWVLVELRDAANAAAATPSTIIARKAALILNDGSVVNQDGSPDLMFANTVSEQLFVVIWHRNHLGVMSAIPLVESGGIYTYNFTTGLGMAYLNGQKLFSGGIYGMIAGDADASGVIDAADKNSYWTIQAGKRGYLNTDFDLNGQVQNQDKNDLWLPNLNANCQVPQ
jgi:hypothetical protein